MTPPWAVVWVTGLLVWQLLTAAALRTDVATLKSDLKSKDLIIQAKDTTAASCTAALGRVSAATSALSQATTVAYAQADKALQAAQDRASGTAETVQRLLSVRAPEGQDCKIARGLAQAAWEEGQ